MIEQLSSREKYMTDRLDLATQIADALLKDQGPLGDVTTLALIEAETTASAKLVVKGEEGVLSGLEIVRQVFEIADPDLNFTPLLQDGDRIYRGDTLAKIEGKGRSILRAERVALEFIRRMSGIASKTNLFVREVEDTNTRILDTRKVSPGFGQLDKQAVTDGGGQNHRQNLSEMGLIKNNHIDLLGGNIELAIHKFRDMYPDIPLEIEVRNENELISALVNLPERILLDNMSNAQTTSAVAIRNKYFSETGTYIPLEASGNMTLDRVRSVAETGVDFISIGELTHSVQAFDISLHISFNK